MISVSNSICSDTEIYKTYTLTDAINASNKS